jgi:hypothetical protein
LEIKSAIAVYAAILVFIAVPVVAAPVTEREKNDCRADYQRYCNVYPLGSDALRACMSRSIKKLSNLCVEALVDAGEMNRIQADKLRHKAGHAKRAKPKHSHRRARKKY